MFTILEHTADIGFRAWGKSLEEMFGNASLALVSIAMETETISEGAPFPVAAEGEDLESLLVNWLSEVLYYVDGQRIALKHFEVEEVAEHSARGIAWGEPRDDIRHRPKLVVKGVTYHQISVAHEDGRWTCEVYLDV